MRKKGNSITVSAIWLVYAVLFSLTGCVDQGIGPGDIAKPYKEEVIEVFEGTVQAGVSLDIETYNGIIDVYLWDNQGYKVEVIKWARASTSAKAKEIAEGIAVDFSEGKTLELDIQKVKDAGANVTMYLPKTTFSTIELSTSNGPIKTEEITASDILLKTSNGSITAYVTADDITIKTSNGSIEGFFQGETVDIETSNGSIEIQCGDGGEYNVETSNARIAITAGSRGDFDISTSNGSIDVTVTGGVTFDLKTSNGSIQVYGDVTYTLEGKTHKKGSTAEEPAITITASTSNASITVKGG